MPTYKGWRWRALEVGKRYRAQIMVATSRSCIVVGSWAISKRDAENKAKRWIDKQTIKPPNTAGCAWPKGVGNLRPRSRGCSGGLGCA